ncbi:MAG: hypothetical protein K9G76_01150 [Bacteroidales bacterium]|nr:hypothetical protein [Bacteroidales bacterium]MCF8402722.1 hypothetical protein [Bacteroidales bacterium]
MKALKYISFFSSTILIMFWSMSAVFSQGTWEIVNVPTTQNLHSVFFADSIFGWAVGDSGIIIHTSDGGDNWIIQDSQTENEIANVFFLNKNLGWATTYKFSSLPYGTLLLKTTDGGQNWFQTLYPEENVFITCILFRDSLNGWMGGRPHTLVHTTNGGIDWEQADVDTSTLAFFPVLNIQFYNDNYGYACGGMFDIAGVIWRTSNGGEKWYALDPSFAPADEVHQLHLFDSLHVMGAGGDPDFGYGVALMRSWNGGIDWDYEELGIQGNAFDLDFRTEAEAWCPLGAGRKLIYSLDSGTTWNEIITPDSTLIFDIIFPDSLHGFGVGREGAFIRYIPPEPVSTGFDLTIKPANTLETWNFPNPFKSSTRIEFELPSSTNLPSFGAGQNCNSTELRVYNSQGETIFVKRKKVMEPRDQYFDIDADILPSGVYYYQIDFYFPKYVKPFTASQRMILIK